MNRVLIILCILGIIGCVTPKVYPDGAYGIKVKTQNPNVPYIYKNGYSNYEIQPVLSITRKDSIYVNELRFQAVYSAMYSKKMMYDKFGDWDDHLYLKDRCHPILLWEKVKLFENDDTLFYVATDGDESYEHIYASFIVIDETGQDCLADAYPKKDSIINYFSNAIKTLSKDEKFYPIYWEIVPECEYNNSPKD